MKTKRRRKLPRAIYPHGAEQDLYAQLAKWLDDWFSQIESELTTLDALVTRSDDFFEDLSNEIQEQINRAERVKARLSIARARDRINRIFDQAREQWSSVDPSELLRRAGNIVKRTVFKNFARHIKAFKPNFSISLEADGDLFGEYQSQIDAYTREASLLIKDIGEKSARDIERLVQETVAKGKSTKSFAKILREQKGYAKNRAALIARDQIGKLTGSLTKIRQQEAGINKYEWQTSGDSRVRPKHAELDGTIRTYGVGIEPGQEIRCRCIALPVFD